MSHVQCSCHNPSFGLVTKAKRGYKVASQEEARESRQEEAWELRQEKAQESGKRKLESQGKKKPESHITYSQECKKV